MFKGSVQIESYNLLLIHISNYIGIRFCRWQQKSCVLDAYQLIITIFTFYYVHNKKTFF